MDAILKLMEGKERNKEKEGLIEKIRVEKHKECQTETIN